MNAILTLYGGQGKRKRTTRAVLGRLLVETMLLLSIVGNAVAMNPVSGLTATPVSANQINLTWVDTNSNEIGSYVGTSVVPSTAGASLVWVGPNATSYSATGLMPGTTYAFTVTVYGPTGQAPAASNTVTAKTFQFPPNAPSGASTQQGSSTNITVVWADKSTDETGFKIERKTGAGGTYSTIATVGPNLTNYNNFGLAPGTTYFYRVRASNAAGDSAPSNEAKGTTSAPDASPTALIVAGISGTNISLTWTNNATNEASFYIERKTGANGTYSLAGTSGTSPFFADAGLAKGTTYFYRVRAGNVVGFSGYSNEVNVTTLSPPSIPSGLNATVASLTQINLAWTDTSNNETGFKIERKDGASGTYSQIALTNSDAITYGDAGIRIATTYFYRIRATNSAGDSGYSNEVSIATFPPITPAGLAATTASGTQINLAWVDTSANESGFKVERKTGAGGTYAQIATVGRNVTSYGDTGLANGTAYFYRVRATNGIGDSGYSNETSATTLAPPNIPTGLGATTISGTQINLAWTDASSDEAAFKIERKTGASGTYGQVATVGADVTSYGDSGLSLGTAYFYRIRATNSTGDSGYSNEANATTAALPNAPAGLSATTVGGTQINLAWTDTSSDETAFKIERKIGAGGIYGEIATVGANVTAYSDGGLSPGAPYFYRVRAVNIAGNSAYSNETSATLVTATAVLFIEVDHLNTPRMIADQTRTTVWRWDQGEPFGNDVPNDNPSGAGTFNFPLRFPGQHFDRETNLAYNYLRDYDPRIGRYTQSDPIGLKGSLNTYAYVDGSPVSNTDPFGLWTASVGGRGSFFFSGAGGTFSGSVGISGSGQVCFQIQSCGRLGVGESIGVGATASAGTGEFCEGNSLGFGGFTNLGLGYFGGVSSNTTSNGTNVSATFGGGLGISAGVQTCTTFTFCARP